MTIAQLPEFVRRRIKEGTVIPAMPLALKADRSYNEVRQRALVRYYIDAGSGGIAVGVHSTQFEIRDPEINLFEKVLSGVSTMIDEYSAERSRPMIKIGGICGRTEQALAEAKFLVGQGYHAGLMSMAAFGGDPALKENSIEAMIDHCRAVAEVIPLVGFYLQPDVGGRVLPYEFWRAFAMIDNVLAIKMAPFNRYRTLDVVRAVCDSGKEDTIALYTGNDDHIVLDLLTEYRVVGPGGSEKRVRIVGGLLGQWCLWTRKAVALHAALREYAGNGRDIPQALLTYAEELTDANAAVFDSANRFAGCIPGIHEVLRRQGLLEGTWCLNPKEVLSPGQAEEIDRVCRSYPFLTDDAFVKENLEGWLA